jgi:hypothetical protein
MFFSPQELVAKLSRGMTLEAGDIILAVHHSGPCLGKMMLWSKWPLKALAPLPTP